MAPMQPSDLIAWVESRRAAEDRERSELRQAGPNPSAAIESALALVALAGHLHGWPVPKSEVDLREEELVRQRWAKVRLAFGKP
ncbi:MAG: hypothetical protein QOH06_5626 [Acidobacteriota bacterium]|nr:hypothetical protein [Acidobacteriota bacterium]